jgi:hypothetical protein
MRDQRRMQTQPLGECSELEVRHYYRPPSMFSPTMISARKSLKNPSGGAHTATRNRWAARRYRRGYYGYGQQTAGSQWAAGIQACLAQLVGPWVPQNGIIGPQTRRAIQMFQGQQQMPVTGLLDSNTANAIQGACSGQGAAPPVPVGPPPAAMAPPPPGPPDAGGAPGAGGPPPDAGEAEIGSSEAEQETEQEFRVDAPCQVQIDWHDPIPLAKDEHFRWAPDVPAVYIVYVSGKPWHVSIAEHNLRHHLLHRAKALRDLNIPLTTLTNRSVGWASLRAGAVPHCAIQHRHSQADPNAPFRPVHAKHGILRLLKRYFVKKFQTENKGNLGSEAFQIGPNGSLTIFDKGKQAAKLASGSQI